MLTRKAKNNLDIQQFDFCSVEDNAQLGFFHSKNIPILGFLITAAEVKPVTPHT